MTPHRLAGATIALAGIATWSLIGYVAEEPGPDHIIRLPGVERRVEVGIGLLALAGSVFALRSLLLRHGPWLRKGWSAAYLQVLNAVLVLAIGGRIVTAGSNGANIGGGFVLMFGPVLAILLLNGARIDAGRITERGAIKAWGAGSLIGTGALLVVALMAASYG